MNNEKANIMNEKETSTDSKPVRLTPLLCANCGADEFGLCDIEGYRHLCLPCATQKMYEELDEQINEELRIFAERTGREMTYNEFCYWCGIDIDAEKIQDMPELKSAYESEMAAIAEYNNRDPQLELPLGDLPF